MAKAHRFEIDVDGMSGEDAVRFANAVYAILCGWRATNVHIRFTGPNSNLTTGDAIIHADRWDLPWRDERDGWLGAGYK